jgi:hypothetical protein
MAALVVPVVTFAIENPYIAVYAVYGGAKAVRWGARKAGAAIDRFEVQREERRREAHAVLLLEARTCHAYQLLAFATTWSARLGEHSAAGWLRARSHCPLIAPPLERSSSHQ